MKTTVGRGALAIIRRRLFTRFESAVNRMTCVAAAHGQHPQSEIGVHASLAVVSLELIVGTGCRFTALGYRASTPAERREAWTPKSR